MDHKRYTFSSLNTLIRIGLYIVSNSVLKRERLSGIITHRFTVDFQAHLAGNRPVNYCRPLVGPVETRGSCTVAAAKSQVAHMLFIRCVRPFHNSIFKGTFYQWVHGALM